MVVATLRWIRNSTHFLHDLFDVEWLELIVKKIMHSIIFDFLKCKMSIISRWSRKKKFFSLEIPIPNLFNIFSLNMKIFQFSARLTFNESAGKMSMICYFYFNFEKLSARQVEQFRKHGKNG